MENISLRRQGESLVTKTIILKHLMILEIFQNCKIGRKIGRRSGQLCMLQDDE